jgi:hypothetical protein
MAKDTFYDAISEEPIKMLDEFVESAFEGIASLFKDSSSPSSSGGGGGTRHHSGDSGSGGGQQSGGGCTCCSWFCRCR